MKDWLLNMACSGFLTPILLLVAISSASGQAAPANYLFVVTIEAKTDQRAAFEAYEQQIAEAQRMAGDARTVTIYQTRLGGPITRYRVVIPFRDYREMDSWPSVPELLTRAYGERDGARILAEGTAFVHYAVRQFDDYADIGTWPGPPTLLQEELGREVGAQVLALANAAVRSRTLELIEVREDLSYVPE